MTHVKMLPDDKRNRLLSSPTALRGNGRAALAYLTWRKLLSRATLAELKRREDAMFDIPVRDVMKRRKLLAAAPTTTVSKACVLMEKKNVGAILVVQHGALIGIFTERDAAFRVIAQGRDPQDTRLIDVMTPAPKTVSPDKPYGYALLMMQTNGFRHVPVIENGKPVGIVSSRNALDPELEEFLSEERRREHIREMP